MLLMIQEVALPQMIRIMSFLAVAQLFQKWSSERTKFDLCVSIQGISSMKIIFFFWVSFDFSMNRSNKWNASFQLEGSSFTFFIPAEYSDSVNSLSCSLSEAPYIPVC
ncbi:Uncharacterised protein [Segatella copri]|nr:Uncharacterised protein [Segatella copri]